ncbi:hypothetical protein I302_109108 [Kwoniella bestiolae CBS 10118]|uniref:Altered inheritance of mitochondria protein 6 n=1 Tax=Kwoniella bestiolae CBS 10118 TaxID=1296100 RepID=A0A1B9FV05_9TREE|nr:hypothetical protein I302_08253 [Kwoniella bestiolae CBS 10118]OCF22602.1 hypothetical protein I302_08253 [Kwoniella bestiolae CBS 10118]
MKVGHFASCQIEPIPTTSFSANPAVMEEGLTGARKVSTRSSLLQIRPKHPFLPKSGPRTGIFRVSSSTPLLGSRKRTVGSRLRSRCLIMVLAGFGLVLGVMVILTGCWGGRKQSWARHPDWNMHYGKNPSSIPHEVIPANSHNDEMQGSNGLQLALSLGYGYIEIDTYLGPSPHPNTSLSLPNSTLDPSLTLLAGHDPKDLKAQRTLKEWYFDPLLDILDGNNRRWNGSEDGWTGVYERDPNKEVGILIDMKRDGDLIWPYLLDHLQPFISRNYLTYYNTTSSTWNYGPLIIIGTGSTPISKVYHSEFRYIFYDAPLIHPDEPLVIPKSNDGPFVSTEWSREIAPMASSKLPLKYYLSTLPHFIISRKGRDTLRCRLKDYTATARERGIKSRWWGVAGYPRWLKLRMWEVIWETGQEVLNTDDLAESRVWLRGRKDGDRRLGRC